MSGEDVYDVARNWCHVCDADHEDCDAAWLDDLTYECIVCHKPIEDEDEDDETEYGGSWAHQRCAAAVEKLATTPWICPHGIDLADESNDGCPDCIAAKDAS